MSKKPVLFNNLTQAQEAAAKLGIDTTNMRSMAAITAAINKKLAGKRAAKPSFPHNIPQPPQKPTPFDPKKNGLGDLIAAAKSERDIGKKIDLLQELSAKQFAAMQAEQDGIRKTELTRAWQSTERSLAYAKMAQSPEQARSRRLLDMASE